MDKEVSDIIFMFHIDVRDITDIRTDYEMVGYGGFSRNFRGGVVATTSAYKYTKGTLVVDALSPKTKKILWRGVVNDELSSSESTPDEKSKYIDKVILELINNFPKKSK